MPYRWTDNTRHADHQELRLWPHNSLPVRGFAAFMLATFTLAVIPLLAMLGTILLWGLLPFMLITLAGTWFAIRRNEKDRQILEVLTVGPNQMHLTRTNPKGDTQEWDCNTYWAKVEMHPKGGPVPNYVTLKGAGREVELGAFLSEDERKTLYSELCDELRRISRPD